MAQLQELQAQLSAAQEQLATMADLKGAVSTLTASLAEKEAAFAGMKAKLAELEGDKAQAAVDSRRAMLAEQLPADQVDMNLNALASLDDASFSVIVGQFKATKDARAASFEEVGGEGVESEAPKKEESEVSRLEKIRAVGVASAKAMK
jgi:septal ring factor EnvC (AmiA/AmiB activator)